MVEKHATVWVLGSGFSKPLGGPMLHELMTPNVAEAVQGKYGGFVSDAGPSFLHIASVFDVGLPEPAREKRDVGAQVARAGYWKHAEEFLECLDRVAASQHSLGTFRIQACSNNANYGSGVPPKIGDARKAAQTFVALQCRLFTDEADRDSEVWRCYKHWASAVQNAKSAKHSIVTFNYDLVPELLGFEVALPKEPTPSGVTPVLKLHGSSNWLRQRGTAIGIQSLGDATLTPQIVGNEGEFAIAVPGASKAKSVEDTFAPLWAKASVELANAHSIIFIGYRFPESDSDARSKLLHALWASIKGHVSVHIVLGPQRSDDVTRLEALIRYTLRNAKRLELEWPHDEWRRCPDDGQNRTFSVAVHPLWAQDFVGLWDPKLTE